MKKNGFTLAELLVVIIIIGMILVIALPSVSKIITNQTEDAYNVQIKLIEEATKLYSIQNKGQLLSKSGECIRISYNTIKNAENIEEKKVTCSGDIILRKTVTNNFTYEYYLECKDKNNKLVGPAKGTVPATCVTFP